jgi:hypothetical protein
LKENRLSSADDRDRALGQTMDALAKMSRLCADASAYAMEPAPGSAPVASMPLARFVDDIRNACTSAGLVTFHEALPAGDVRCVRAASLETLVDAVTVILGAAKRAAGRMAVGVSVVETGNESRFLMGREEDRARLETESSVFDPWRGGHTIALPLACRTVAEAGGRVWTLPDAHSAVGISVPLEDSAS